MSFNNTASPTPTPSTTTGTSITTLDNASTHSLALTLSVNWKDEKNNGNPTSVVPTAATSVNEEAGTTDAKTGSLIIRTLFIIGFFLPVAWIIAAVKVFILDNRKCISSPSTIAPATSAHGQTDIEANILPKKEGKYREGAYWAFLSLLAGTAYIAGGLTLAWIFHVEKHRERA
ncbi:hypothetical protein L873DRAFT_1797356 [Choiromyces venosus 120613-1]|uniref:Uncharacterized protein n=1 Tax=Choiromyces venosus 120613-1 TaxID=1336337 RepID=A0A3N4K5I7_9PEZI|nr:hypothetical protein L873DRAFT_1797356 [Choiromyces venosus 120613-1]